VIIEGPDRPSETLPWPTQPSRPAQPVQPAPPAAPATVAPAGERYVVNRSVGVHDRPWSNTPAFATLRPGTVVIVTGESAGWYRVSLGQGVTGFVIGKSLDKVPGAAPAPPAPAPTVQPAPRVAPAPAPTPAVGTYPPAPQLWQPFKDCTRCPEMVVIGPGTFTMGSPSGERGRDGDEGPRRPVTIARLFALGKYEVTFDEWNACVEAGGCRARFDEKGWGKGRRPVINVTWNDAKAYVRWLAAATGKPYRLPSEAEWEYAARGGATAARPWGQAIGRNRANCDGCGSRWDDRSTAPVGSFGPNGFGLYDVLGNVWEWVADCYSSSYAAAPPDGSARLQPGCGQGVMRGGSWESSPRRLRFANRQKHGANEVDNDFGLRVARDVGQ
jgi:formylglycine-generating enzyme required for sulfatase activity